MKATKLFLVALLAFTTALGYAGDNKENKKTTYKVDLAESKIEWLGKKVTGEHFGDIRLNEGSIEVNGNKIAGGSFVADMNSITCLDLTDKTYNAKLVNHLKSDDFFGVEKFPVSELEITSVTPKGGSDYEMKGNLTIKGITHEITFPATVNLNGASFTAEADITVDRSKYNVRYGSGKFFDNLGDNMIYDNFSLKVKLVGDQVVL